MLVKRNAQNQVTLPDSAVAALGDPEGFEVSVDAGRIVLTPVHVQRGDDVRAKLADLGITEADVADAVAFVRTQK